MAWVINQPIDDFFTLSDNGNAPMTGKVKADFAICEAFELDTPLTTAVVALVEVGTGRYRTTFTPTVADQWGIRVVFNSGGVYRAFEETYDVLAKQATVIVVPPTIAADQLTTMNSELITRGDAKTWDLPLVDMTGLPFDLTGCTVWFTVKARFNQPDEDAVVSSSWTAAAPANGITVDDPTSGEISFGLTAEQSSDLIASLYVADVQVLEADGTVQTVWKLRLAVGAGTTNRVSVP